MQWVRDHSKPYKLELKYSPAFDDFSEIQALLLEAKSYCKKNNIMYWDDGFFYIRFTNERDLAWFLLRYS